MFTNQTITAEFVTPKHPDKICDRIADAIVDRYLKEDPHARTAIEVAGGHGHLFIVGEVTSKAAVTEAEIRKIAQTIAEDEKLEVKIVLDRQSPEIARGVDAGGAGDQVVVTGYACRDNELFLPHEYYYAYHLTRYLYELFPYDGKVALMATWPGVFHAVFASFQHAPTVKLEEAVRAWVQQNRRRVLMPPPITYVINGAGDWKIGGFDADSGVTGRKIVMDNYGPRVPIGGGAFSGKDPSKLDRSAAYFARKIALRVLKKKKNAEEVFVRMTYAMGKPEAIYYSILVGGTPLSYQERDKFLPEKHTTPRHIIKTLNLTRPIYTQTAAWGHFTDPAFPWNNEVL